MTTIRDRQIRLVHELMYEIKVSEAMTADVISFPPTATYREVQVAMKTKRFSGAPIVDKGMLVGIVTIDDIITAFDKGVIDCPVRERMTRDIISVPQNYSVIAATNIFHRYRFGRLPVVDAPGSQKLVGILTYGDILSHLVLVVNSIAERFEEQEAATEAHEAHSPSRPLRYALAPDNFDRAGVASTSIKKWLKENGVPPAILRRVAVICYEAEMNVVIHSLGGYMEIQLDEKAVRILVVDEGPGIPDLDSALRPGYTTANEKIRALGFGAGMGLPNMKRCADSFDIRSSMETGTEIQAVVLLDPPPDDSSGNEEEGK